MLEVAKHNSEFPEHYYYDYEYEIEAKRRRIQEMRKIEEDKIKSTINYKFKTLDKEDQWALIGAACCIIVVLIIVCYMLIQVQ